MIVNWWTVPELRIAIAAAQAGGTHAAIAKQLQKLGYRRTPAAVNRRLRTSGITVEKRWTAAERDALRTAYANRTDRQAACPARSMSAIRTKARELGLIYPGAR